MSLPLPEATALGLLTEVCERLKHIEELLELLNSKPARMNINMPEGARLVQYGDRTLIEPMPIEPLTAQVTPERIAELEEELRKAKARENIEVDVLNQSHLDPEERVRGTGSRFMEQGDISDRLGNFDDYGNRVRPKG